MAKCIPAEYPASVFEPLHHVPLRATRWAPANVRAEGLGINSLPTSITASMTSEQVDAYITHFRIIEITDMLQKGHHSTTTTNQRQRSSSPEPEYDSSGRRINTRPQRYLRRLEQERHQLIKQAVGTIPNYRPPPGYVPETNLTTKVYVPVVDFPHIDFIGQILGPRGSSLKSMSTSSNAQIVIRGRGSVKEGRGRRATRLSHTSDNEPLHCLITASSLKDLDKAKQLVQRVIDNAISSSDGDNERKRQQLRDLALMNGTFRDDEGSQSRRLLEYPDDPDVGNFKIGDMTTLQPPQDADFDREYERLLCDIGEEPQAARTSKLPPWRATCQRHQAI